MFNFQNISLTNKPGTMAICVLPLIVPKWQTIKHFRGKYELYDVHNFCIILIYHTSTLLFAQKRSIRKISLYEFFKSCVINCIHCYLYNMMVNTQ